MDLLMWERMGREQTQASEVVDRKPLQQVDSLHVFQVTVFAASEGAKMANRQHFGLTDIEHRSRTLTPEAMPHMTWVAKTRLE